ncbi:acyltransferase family protein [Paracoccus sediminilitoris]|uniref:acyltransferase family protein n=1 Tax=Paracoccus sediminilitoris TaxID=2202419 RepID=UPI00272D84AD|nr:acyltransferase family protein [Paracoccus sediminilitoris]
MQGRVISIDYLRVLLAGFVVLGHSGFARDVIGDTGLAVGNSILRVAVPVFTIIAGYFLATTLRRGRLSPWVGQLLAMYAIWSLVYIVFLWPYFSTRPVSLTLRDLTLGFMHLWFLQGIAIAGIMLGGFRRLGPRAVVLSAVAFALLGLGLQYARMTELSQVPIEHYRNGPFYLYPFLAMGWLMAEGMRMRMAVLAAILGLAMTVAENMLWIARIGHDPLLEIPLGHFLLCPAIFMLVRRIPMPATTLPLGAAAAGIYVMHVIVLQGLPLIGVDDLLVAVILGIALPFGVVWARQAIAVRRSGIRP